MADLRTISDEDWFLTCAVADAIDENGFSVPTFRAALAHHGLAICEVEPPLTLMACEACDGDGGYEEGESYEYPFGRSAECPHCNGMGYLVIEGETDTEQGSVQ